MLSEADTGHFSKSHSDHARIFKFSIAAPLDTCENKTWPLRVTCRLLLGGLGGGAGLAAASGATAKQRRAAAAAAVACASVALRASAAGCCQTWTWPPSWPGRAQSLDASAAKAAAAAAIAPAAEAHAAHLLRAVVRSSTLDTLGAFELLRVTNSCVSRCAGFEGGIDERSFDLPSSLPASSSSWRSSRRC